MAVPFGTKLPKLDPHEVLAQTFAADLPKQSAEYRAYYDYIEDLENGLVDELADAEYDALLATLEQSPPQAVLDAILERALSGAKDLTTNLLQAELNKLGNQIAIAAAEGEGPREVAEKLDAVKGLDANRAKSYENFVAELEAREELSANEIERRAEAYYQQLLRERRETIARTEMRHGTSAVNKANAEARGARFKVWQTVGDSAVSDECQANEAQGPIAIGDTFEGGVDVPPQHPNCRCTVAYVSSESVRDVYERRAEARAERTAAAKGQESDT